MPVVNIKIVKGRSVAQKRNLVRAITEALVKTTDVKAESVSVLIEEYERENWATGGELRADIIADGTGKKKSSLKGYLNSTVSRWLIPNALVLSLFPIP